MDLDFFQNLHWRKSDTSDGKREAETTEATN